MLGPFVYPQIRPTTCIRSQDSVFRITTRLQVERTSNTASVPKGSWDQQGSHKRGTVGSDPVGKAAGT